MSRIPTPYASRTGSFLPPCLVPEIQRHLCPMRIVCPAVTRWRTYPKSSKRNQKRKRLYLTHPNFRGVLHRHTSNMITLNLPRPHLLPWTPGSWPSVLHLYGRPLIGSRTPILHSPLTVTVHGATSVFCPRLALRILRTILNAKLSDTLLIGRTTLLKSY